MDTIFQGYASEAMRPFNFLEMYKLREYDNIHEPVVIFGCYNQDDENIIKNHKSQIVIQWQGLDSNHRKHYRMFSKNNIINTTVLPNVKKYLEQRGVECLLLKPASPYSKNPQILGNKIYAYVNKNRPEYYGLHLINMLKKEYDIIIGDNSICRKSWLEGECEKFYKNVFIGLQLSEYAGGGYSVIEMGLRGIKVITNVINLPNVIKWNSIDDIRENINCETKNRGLINIQLAENVFNSLIHISELNGFNLNQLIIQN